MFSTSKKTRQALESLQSEVNALRNQVTATAQQAEAEQSALASLLQQVATMETRITGMGAELSRQLHELGTDIEKLQQHADNDTVNETVHALKLAQIRLAAEQARYEITFRQDLADLANELLKRSR
jgi:predicted  nucleic acid-binding Zn-ribbon protein